MAPQHHLAKTGVGILQGQRQQIRRQLLHQTLQGVVALATQGHEVEHVLLDLEGHVAVVLPQQGEHLLLVTLIAVEDVGHLTHPVHLGAGLVGHVGETTIQGQPQLGQHMLADRAEAGDPDQQIVVERPRQGIEHGRGGLGRQEGEQHRLHLGVFVAKEAGQDIRGHPLQALDVLAHRIAIEAVEQAAGEALTQRQIQGLLQVFPRRAADAALLAILVEELLQGPLCLYRADAGEARHLGDEPLHFVPRQLLHHLGGRLCAHAQQQDGGLLEVVDVDVDRALVQITVVHCHSPIV